MQNISLKEQIFVSLVAQDLTNDEIAMQLNTKLSRVKTGLKRLYKKYNVKTKAGLVYRHYEAREFNNSKERGSNNAAKSNKFNNFKSKKIAI